MLPVIGRPRSPTLDTSGVYSKLILVWCTCAHEKLALCKTSVNCCIFLVKFYTISAVVRCHWCRQVRDGQSASARHIGRYCGQLMPPAITTTTRYLFVRFVSDAFNQRNGFSLSYVTNGLFAYCCVDPLLKELLPQKS